MTKGLKTNFPLYVKKEEINILGSVTVSRLTPKTFEQFLKKEHGPDTKLEDYYIIDVLNLEKNN